VSTPRAILPHQSPPGRGSFEKFKGAQKQSCRDFMTDCLRDPEIDNQFKIRFGGLGFPWARDGVRAATSLAQGVPPDPAL
jgi:hypothetical protein